MANYITTLEDKNQDGILPRTVVKAIADKNGQYLDEDLVKSDIDALKNGKIASMDSAITSLSWSIGDNIIAESKEFTITLTSEVKWHRFNVATYESLVKSGYTIIGILDMNSNYIDNAIYVWNIGTGYGLYVNVYWLAQVAVSCPVRCYVLYKKNT